MLSRKTVFSSVVLFLLLFYSGSLCAAEGLIKKVVFLEKKGNTESVVFHLNGPWLPKAFALNGENPRVVFDFMETRMARTVPTSIDAGGDMIRKIRIGRHSNKTRVVMDLTAGGSFNFDQQFDEKENILTIQLFPVDFPEKTEKLVIEVEQEKLVAAAPEIVVEENPVVAEVVVDEPEEKAAEEIVTVEVVETSEVAEIVAVEELRSRSTNEINPALDPLLTDVSFENTSSKGEMVLFKLNGFYPPSVSGEEDGTPLVICDFAGTRLGDAVVKEQATRGEYVERVSVKQLEDSDLIRVTLELVPNKNYDLQQVFFKEDNLFVIIVNSYNKTEETKDQIQSEE